MINYVLSIQFLLSFYDYSKLKYDNHFTDNQPYISISEKIRDNNPGDCSPLTGWGINALFYKQIVRSR